MQDDRDLGALAQGLLRAAVERETPLLAAEGLEMWEYVVLVALRAGAAPTQAQLATAAGRDKTRLIPLLDGLERRGLVDRTPDPADRRNRVVSLTDEGRELLERARAAIRAMEDADLLAPLDDAERATLRSLLARVVS
jgi:DNA-binding MarR family transcriptional regulator